MFVEVNFVLVFEQLVAVCSFEAAVEPPARRGEWLSLVNAPGPGVK